jgi:hypothetical protein
VGAGGGWMVLLVAMLALVPRAALAQLPLDIWIRPLAALPIGGFASRDHGVTADASVGFDAGGAVALGPLAIYGEYQEIAFGCEECEEVELEGSVLDRGWGAGVLVPLRSPIAGFEPWGRIGVIGHHLRFRSNAEAAYSSSALGWAAGIGAEARPLRWLRIEPALLLRGYEAGFGFAIDVPDRDVSVTYIALGLGIGIGL